MKAEIFSFSGIYQEDGYTWEQKQNIQELCAWTGTDCYLDPETEKRLERLLQKQKEEGTLGKIRILDSGNYHYMSKLLLGMEPVKKILVVFDHHTDMQPPALLPVLSCGSWIRDAVEAYNEQIAGVCIVGPPQASVKETEPWEGVFFITQEEIAAGNAKEMLQKILERFPEEHPVYISVDKDVLSGEELVTNWDQGILGEKELEQLISCCLKKRLLLCADICGEPGKNASEGDRKNSSRVNQDLFHYLEMAVLENGD